MRFPVVRCLTCKSEPPMEYIKTESEITEGEDYKLLARVVFQCPTCEHKIIVVVG